MGKGWVLAAAAPLLFGCSAAPVDQPAEQKPDRIACAVGGKAQFSADCTLERVREGDQPVLVVRHADGGFRRFAPDAAGLVSLDGVEAARTSALGDVWEVTIGADRYRIPVAMSALPQ